MIRDVLNSPRLSELKNRRRKAILNKFIILTLGFGIATIFLTYLSRIDKLNINSIEIIGNKVIDPISLEETIRHEIAGHYLWIFPKTNIFFYPKDKVENVLRENYKRLKNINLSIKNSRVLEVSLTEREPKYTWCGDIPIFKNEDIKCYFMDEGGYIFDTAPYFSGEVYFRFYGKVDLKEGDPSGSYFSQPYFNQLVLFKTTLESLKLKTAAIFINKENDVRVLLSPFNISATKPEIIFKVDADLMKLAENLQAALTTEPLQTDFKKKYSSLLYIDLRFGNKVYYKFQ